MEEVSEKWNEVVKDREAKIEEQRKLIMSKEELKDGRKIEESKEEICFFLKVCQNKGVRQVVESMERMEDRWKEEWR